jgi:hypothetical protein
MSGYELSFCLTFTCITYKIEFGTPEFIDIPLKGETIMTPQPNLDQSVLIQLSQAEYRCPQCNEVVVKVAGNQLMFLMDSKHAVHARTSNLKDGDNEYIVVKMHHLDKPDIQPGH